MHSRVAALFGETFAPYSQAVYMLLCRRLGREATESELNRVVSIAKGKLSSLSEQDRTKCAIAAILREAIGQIAPRPTSAAPAPVFKPEARHVDSALRVLRDLGQQEFSAIAGYYVDGKTEEDIARETGIAVPQQSELRTTLRTKFWRQTVRQSAYAVGG
jgi:hypothetical protein